MTISASNFCVLLVCDHSYMRYAAALVRQINAMETVAVDVLIASPDELTPDAIEAGARHLRIEIKDFIKDLPSNERLKNYCYWRIPAIDLAAQSYERVLYLDVDIYCAAPAVAALMDIPMGERAIAAVRDIHLQYRPKRPVPEYVEAGLDHAGYFNSGVLLVDSANWQAANAMERLEKVCQEFPNALMRQDQSMLNLAFYKDWLEISPVWNWQFSKRNANAAIHAGPRYYHYLGERKLWNSNPDCVVKSHWLHFQGLISKLSVESRCDIKKEMDSFSIASIWYRRALLKYLNRFSHELDVIDHGQKMTKA